MNRKGATVKILLWVVIVMLGILIALFLFAMLGGIAILR